MTEKQLLLLGFEKQQEDDLEDSYYYYALTITKGIEFITQASDEVKEDNWIVEFFETETPLVFDDIADLKTLITILKKHIKNE